MSVPEVDFFTCRFLYLISTWIWDDQGSEINDCGLLVYEATKPNPVPIPTTDLLEIHPNIIHPSTPRSPQRSLSLRFPHQDPIRRPLLPHTSHMPTYYITLFKTQNWLAIERWIIICKANLLVSKKE